MSSGKAIAQQQSPPVPPPGADVVPYREVFSAHPFNDSQYASDSEVEPPSFATYLGSRVNVCSSFPTSIIINYSHFDSLPVPPP